MATFFLSFLIIALTVFLIALNSQFKLFHSAKRKLRILEYHSISTNGFEDQITIRKEKLIEQFQYLKENNYTTLWLSEMDALKSTGQDLPEKTVILTFDDGFADNYTELYPLLIAYNFKAVCFVVLGRIGKTADWNGKFVNKNMRLMTKEQLLSVSSHIELGYHSFKHDNYSELSFEEIEKDLQLCQEVISKENIKIFPGLAYTYGRYYRKKGKNQKLFFEILRKYGIKYCFRIGNRINVFPIKNIYQVQRIDIRGTDSFKNFKTKLKLGRKKLF